MTKNGRTRQEQRAVTQSSIDGVRPLVKRARLRRKVRDGARELATAIASLCEPVRVDASREPFVTEPADLFDRSFSDVGIGETQMPLVRAQLRRMLPEIGAELDENARVLDQPGHRIESYAAFVRIALLMKVR